MVRNVVFFILIATASGLASEAGVASKVRHLAQVWADVARHKFHEQRGEAQQRAKLQLEQQRVLADALNITQDSFSARDMRILMQEIQSFALSARDEYQMEQVSGVNETRQQQHRKLLEPLLRMRTMNKNIKSAAAKNGTYYVADSSAKMVAVELLYWMAAAGLMYFQGGFQYNTQGHKPQSHAMTGVIILGMYYVLSVLVYMDAGWSAVDALHWATEVPTTIAWGDLSLDHGGNPVRPMQLFTTLHVMFTVLVAANGFQDIFDSLLLDHVDDVVAPMHKWSTEGKNMIAGLILWCAAISAGGMALLNWERCTCSFGPTAVDGCIETDCENTGGYTMNPQEMVYFLVVSLTAVGFGDYSPKSWMGRLFGSVYFLFGNKISDHVAGMFDRSLWRLWGGGITDWELETGRGR